MMYTSIPAEVRRLNGLLTWWGLQSLADQLNRLLKEGSSNNAEIFSAANEQLTRALQEIVSARQPSELIAAQSHLVTSLRESFAAQARSWAELAQKFDACCLGTPPGAALRRPTGQVPTATDGSRPWLNPRLPSSDAPACHLALHYHRAFRYSPSE